MTSNSAAVPRPTPPAERIDAIDVLRGIALFGVMAINLVMEFRVSIFDQFLGPRMLASPIDRAIETILTEAVELKAFALFSLLFGAGLAIQFDRLASSERRIVLLVRRLAVLLVFGVIHLCLIWNGDILTEYALAGFIVLPFLFGPRWLLTLAALLSLALYLAMQAFPPVGLFPSRAAIWQDVMDANRIYATGGLLDVLAFRLREIPLIASLHAFVFLRTIGLFLVGALAWRSRIVQNPRGLFAIALPAIGLGAGLLYRGIEPLGTILLALGYGAAILFAASFERGKKLLGWAAPLGRMAFTNYVAQSVIFGWIFYGYGLGQFGRLGITPALAIGLIVYAAQVRFSTWWLRHYRYGPLEWLWRSLMYGVRQPMVVADATMRTQLSSRTSEAQIRDP
ncbi:DUF418 domain-containing protein [Bradyrhizobium sp. CIAT3101]|uniref:DUF418 domain-containing protein n=1 Tax=Bradyrhizobium sp. CIAT3101 TaxID=439387 RepID=UPI0024B0BD09|nr:DUF418 domain-containing protein [Bradyrhizobium sp. CIAT3101]WFU83226.1 DUF418 domain-containing protein [Bradyrhizobium sp. CIAT3101]